MKLFTPSGTEIMPLRGPLLRCMASDFRAARSQKWIGLTAVIGAAAIAILMVAV